MLTVHVIFNAHLDPIWLWPWHAGIDEALSTCRSACERLDANPDVCFSQGEAWVYHQVERLDPGLFKRIQEHIAAGRWEIIGGSSIMMVFASQRSAREISTICLWEAPRSRM